MHEGADVVEKLGELAVILLLGTMLSLEGLRAPQLSGWLLVPVLLLAIRPLSVALALARSDLARGDRAFVAWFGVRGVGSLYYAAVAAGAGVLGAGETEVIVWTAIACVVVSIALHGTTAAPLSRRCCRPGPRVHGRPETGLAQPARSSPPARPTARALLERVAVANGHVEVSMGPYTSPRRGADLVLAAVRLRSSHQRRTAAWPSAALVISRALGLPALLKRGAATDARHVGCRRRTVRSLTAACPIVESHAAHALCGPPRRGLDTWGH